MLCAKYLGTSNNPPTSDTHHVYPFSTEKVLFTHELDSHGEFSSSDLGTFSRLPNGDDLETGSMPRPNLPGNPVTEYEEVWRELSPLKGPEFLSDHDKQLAWILESVEEQEGNEVGENHLVKTFLGKIGGTYVALQQGQAHRLETGHDGKSKVTKSGGSVVARREEWSEGESGGSGKWIVKYVAGYENDALPALSMQLDGKFEWEGKGSWKEGDVVLVHGQKYIIRAFEGAH